MSCALALTAAMAAHAQQTAEGELVPLGVVSAAYQAGDHTAAREGIRAHAEAGNALAQFRLGYMIANGEGGPFDRAEATQWLEAALQQGHAEGHTLLARVYMSGNP
ncbi:hypothetical protein AIOL_001385 [Candidatus Rhodobacter oscarellae]|uniref:Sel1 repeat family protein n=2 Tax=Candidatus Rhodobacter oscarellae TaxID=1675527 RepID=A0A0J9E0G2_9RHOB|nr:hypothetical protein AIOL_001385 [Candidatus Rhodobacter lobularis]